MKPFLLTLLLLGQAAFAETADSINALLKAGQEVAWVAPNTLAETDEDLAVVFIAHAKSASPAAATAFPTLITDDDILPRDTDALDDAAYTHENAVISLKQKRLIGRLTLADGPERSDVYFPGRNHGSLLALWGPPQNDGKSLGLLVYGSKWFSPEVLLVHLGTGETPSLAQTSIKPLLDTATHKFIGNGTQDIKGANVGDYKISYQPLEVLKSDTAADAATTTASTPITVKLAFTADVPKSDTAPSLEGTLTLRLETSSEGQLTAKVLKVEPASPQ